VIGTAITRHPRSAGAPIPESAAIAGICFLILLSRVFGQVGFRRMKRGSIMRSLLCTTFLGLSLTTIVVLGADNSIGTWKLNIQKSDSVGAPIPVKTLTMTREAEDGGVKVTINGEQTNGAAMNASYTAKYDGKEKSVTGNGPYDAISIKQVNANTFTDERKKTVGLYKVTGRLVISADGKIMTTTTKGANAQGKEFTTILVYEKR
jgi:hypothetical protein